MLLKLLPTLWAEPRWKFRWATPSLGSATATTGADSTSTTSAAWHTTSCERRATTGACNHVCKSQHQPGRPCSNAPLQPVKLTMWAGLKAARWLLTAAAGLPNARLLQEASILSQRLHTAWYAWLISGHLCMKRGKFRMSCIRPSRGAAEVDLMRHAAEPTATVQ